MVDRFKEIVATVADRTSKVSNLDDDQRQRVFEQCIGTALKDQVADELEPFPLASYETVAAQVRSQPIRLTPKTTDLVYTDYL